MAAVESIGYSAKHRVLDVAWKSGALDRALNVSPEFYRRFLAAEYPAIFFDVQTKNAGYRVVSLTVD